ncbi:uncharacterized protein TRIADDRAFT_51887 [Trichoplax adhaerens]|uniref:Zinc finger CCHC domain-containing protein 7 n=1 Tax=Trichoplax adhaerens TaxID=10228 RepID=B3RL58_TRIAD|nr:hypothetical protein TRIADDRAFT_51887 [Trichoplax adhaerens]EDV29489.1 hypothetical protein TRIADDRAFT_51887 [Trichoplax adhaerens]|eukprot:XP_002108691.1 hypothetical protein TRIADDRAFT_51887 [Trichoplax adhaerens]
MTPGNVVFIVKIVDNVNMDRVFLGHKVYQASKDSDVDSDTADKIYGLYHYTSDLSSLYNGNSVEGDNQVLKTETQADCIKTNVLQDEPGDIVSFNSDDNDVVLPISKVMGTIGKKFRYFNNTNHVINRKCHICLELGHLSYQCPMKKKMTCRICGEIGHKLNSCPNQFCYKCDQQGHRGKECPNGLAKDKRKTCRRCFMRGHVEKECPDRWRQYYATTKFGPPKKPPDELLNAQNPRVYCYNCGKKGHYGHECVEARMNSWIPPSIPFVFRFDNLILRNKPGTSSDRIASNTHIRFEESPVEYKQQMSKMPRSLENAAISGKRLKLDNIKSKSAIPDINGHHTTKVEDNDKATKFNESMVT